MASSNSVAAAITDVDLSLINELYEEIERHPPAIEARKVLIQQCLEANWDDAAKEAVKQLLNLVPSDQEAKNWAKALSIEDIQRPPSPVPGEPVDSPSLLPEDPELAKIELLLAYEELRAEARQLQQEIASLQAVTEANSPGEGPYRARFDTHYHNLTTLREGRISTILRVPQVRSVRSVAREMEAFPQKAVDIAFSDLEDLAAWLKTPSNPSPVDSDGIREALVKRVLILQSSLPEALKIHATTAQMHAEHEILKKTYFSEETMLGDLVADIPRSNFLVTDDGYAWDMEELAQAITSNSGVMRNPLSKQLFTANDIRRIVQHPHGIQLAALKLEQDKLSQGVRPKTVEEMEKLSAVLLSDMSADQMESRQSLDAFLAYVATLPEEEQKALEGLKVPAKDSHTGQGFDTTIGDAVRDTQANRICSHKTGDFLRQAAAYLKKKDA